MRFYFPLKLPVIGICYVVKRTIPYTSLLSRSLFTGLILFLSICQANSQFSNQEIPKREFRAVWIATINNLDFPRKATIHSVAQKEQWRKLMKRYQQLGFNAVIVQIRPAGDAFYPTELAPWSKFLTGMQGIGPKPLYDPLAFMIEEAHKCGLEFHAWMNPYRATVNQDTTMLSRDHMYYLRKDWMLKYNKRYYFNPGIPEVQQYLTEVVTEVVANYDIDAIQFDDDFYPNQRRGIPIQDSVYYRKYGKRFRTIGEWRRNNIDSYIEAVATSVKQTKPHVRFGVSPTGVWRNKAKDPRGSDTRASITSYDNLYADVVKWLQMGWIDYVVPQLYSSIGFKPIDHTELLSWWGGKTYGKQLYTGLAAYKVDEDRDTSWQQPSQLPNQVRRSRENYNCQGNAFFSSSHLLKNPLGVRDSIYQIYKTPALLPENPELSLATNGAPNLKKPKLKKGGIRINWSPNSQDKTTKPAYYVIYRFMVPQPSAYNPNPSVKANLDYEDPKNILAITPFFEDKSKYEYYDFTTDEDQIYTYAVRAVNRQHTESKSSKTWSVYLDIKGLRVKK